MRKYFQYTGMAITVSLSIFLIAYSQNIFLPSDYSNSNYNSLTGKGPSYNPYTGQAKSPTKTRPPYSAAKTQSYRNTLTGQVAPQQPAYNPLTGVGGQRLPQPAQRQTQWPKDIFPITGKAGPQLQPFDQVIRMIMDRHGIPGGALAIAKDGKLVYAKGFGWADLAVGLKVHPLTLFGIASLSKPITAMAILKLIEQGKLRLDDRVFEVLRHIRPRPGFRVDPRISKITIRQCLNHSGGWDRQKSGDPITWSPIIARTLNVPMPIQTQHFVTYMMSVPLDYQPGTKAVYSNVGFILLDAVIAKVGGMPYEQFVRRHVLGPMGVRHAVITSPTRQYLDGEARQYLPGNGVVLPPMRMPMARAAAGWSSTVVDLVRFLTTLDGSRGKAFLTRKMYQEMVDPPPAPIRPRPNGQYCGLGWPNVSFSKAGLNYSHTGKWYGMRAFMKRSEKGVNWALVFNVGMEPDLVDANVINNAVQEVRRRVEGITDYPDIDLFKHYQ